MGPYVLDEDLESRKWLTLKKCKSLKSCIDASRSSCAETRLAAPRSGGSERWLQ